MMDHFLNDAGHIQMTYLTLLTNKTEADVWISRLLASGMDVIMKVCVLGTIPISFYKYSLVTSICA